MHPKYWKFPGGAMVRDQAVDDQGSGGAGGGASDDAGKTDAGKAEAAAAETAAAAEADKGKKQPTDEEARLIKEVMQKKEALRQSQEEANQVKERLKAFDGIDPEAVRKLLAEQKAAEEKALEDKGQFDTLRTRMAEEHQRATATLQEQLAAAQALVGAKDRVIDELSIGSQFSQSEFINTETTMPAAKARKLFGEHFDVVEGKVVAYDKPRGEANRTPLVDQYGNNMAFNDAMRKIVESDPDKDHLLKSKVKSGAGSSSKADVKTPPVNQGDASSVDRIGAGLKGLLSSMPSGAL